MWSKIASNIKQARKKNILVTCDGNGKTYIRCVQGEPVIRREFPCNGNMRFDLRRKTQTCDTCGKVMYFHKPDFWSERKK